MRKNVPVTRKYLRVMMRKKISVVLKNQIGLLISGNSIIKNNKIHFGKVCNLIVEWYNS